MEFYKVEPIGQKPAGTKTDQRYVRINLKGKVYTAHRLAWLYTYGEWPKGSIDHINRDKTDNRIKNLRIDKNSVNRVNSKMMSTNTSGFRGVSLIRQTGKWRATFSYRGRNIYLGSFDSPEEASQAYKAKLREMHPKIDFEESMVSAFSDS